MALPSLLLNLPNVGRAISAVQRAWRPGGINNIIAVNNMVRTFAGLITRAEAGQMVSFFRRAVEAGVAQGLLDGTEHIPIGDVPDSIRIRGQGFDDSRFQYLVLVEMDVGGDFPLISRVVIPSDTILSADDLEDRIVDHGHAEIARYRSIGEIGPGPDQPAVFFTILGIVRSF